MNETGGTNTRARGRMGGGWARKAVIGLVCGAATASSLVVGVTTSGAIVPGPNGRIAFESTRTGNTDIFTMGPDGSTQINLTKHPAIDVFPAWSSDGSKITFSSNRHDPDAPIPNVDVFVMNADGSGVTQLTNSPGEDRGTSWTSDDQTIVFHSSRDRDATHTFDIFKMNAAGSNETKIFTNGTAAPVCGATTNGTSGFNSAGDPLGTNPEGDFEIFTMDMNGGNVFQVTDNDVLDSGPKWSPGCDMIAYNSLDEGDSLDVHRIDADGTNDVNLTNRPGVFDAFAAWSPDNGKIVFSSNRHVNFEIYTMNAVDGSDVQRLTFTGLGQADLRSDWGTNTSTPPDTALTCFPRTNRNGVELEVCTASDTDGIRTVLVKNTATNSQQLAKSFDCASAPQSFKFTLPAGTKYNITVTDCSTPRNKTQWVLTADGFLRNR